MMGCRRGSQGVFRKPNEPSGRGGEGRRAQIVCFSPDKIRVKLLVPGTVQRCGDVQTFPI